MKFVDEAKIFVKAGHGGAGAVSFRREKFVPFGGPDGGNGGAGGSVVLVADRNKHTLLDFQFRPSWRAEDGEKGAGRNKEGKSGDDLIIQLPVGTQVFRDGSDDLVIDLDHDEQRFTLCQGGRGGRGNDFFKSPTNRVPQHAQPGEVGAEGTFLLSLKLVADVGIIGFPNAGKSTLISRITSARPKIADYPFTTLTPNLGVVKAKGGRSFVVADVPGLIPGASEGKGLGIQFLKHVERTKVLVHLIDPMQLGDDGEPCPPEQSFELINRELTQFSSELGSRKQIVVLSKTDAAHDEKQLKKALKFFQSKGHTACSVSSATGDGVDELIELMARETFS